MNILKFALPVVFCLLLGGCQSYSEIEDALIVSGIAVDMGEDEKYKVTVEIVKQGSGEGQPPQAELISSEGVTVYSALQNINADTSKKLYFSQTRVIAISEAVARDGLIDIIDVIIRDDQLRITNDVVVAKDCTARELFTLSETGEQIRAYEINKMLQNESENVSVVSEVQIYELINIIGSAGVAAVLPAFSVNNGGEEPMLQIYGTAIFKEDKLIDFLDEKESKIMTLIQGETRTGFISEEIETDTGHYMTVEIFQVKTKVDHKLSGDGIVMDIDITMNVGVNEITAKENIMTRKGREELMKILEKKTKEDVQQLIYKMQNSGEDIFGFGERIYKQNPGLWEKIKDKNYFENLDSEVDVKAELRSTGFIAKSPSARDFRLNEDRQR